MVKPSVDTDTIQRSLRHVAVDLQAHFVQQDGEVYSLDDLQRALTGWLELSIESLVDDALFHTVEGDRSYAFNRPAFETQMQRMQPVQSRSTIHSTDPIAA